MLDGLFGSGFSVKCKSLIKVTRERIEVVRRKAEAKQRVLKDDLGKLLSNGLDTNAYERTEEFIAGMNLLSCYDFVEQSCECIKKKLSIMQKHRECPEECREAVASVVFAAARISDLPELRDLRDLFQQNYGNGLEVYVSEKFVEKLSSSPPAPKKRLRVLQDIASEFSLKWDSRGFKQRMANPSVVEQAEVHKADMVKQRLGLQDGKSRVRRHGEGNMGRRDEADHHVAGRKDRVEHREQYQTNYALPPPYVKSKDNIACPPYVRPKEDKRGQHQRAFVSVGTDIGKHSVEPASCNRSNGVNSSGRSKNKPDDHVHKERFEPASGRVKDLDQEGEMPLPKTRSIPRKPPGSSLSKNAVDTSEDVGAPHRSSSSRRKDHSGKGPQVLFVEDHKKDNEEKTIDELLIHYSKKPSNYDSGKSRKKAPGQPSRCMTANVGESSSRDLHDGKRKVLQSKSLPPEQAASAEPQNVFKRANSFQADNQARHVHPKLPDYDDLAAMFAALKGQ